MDEESRWHIARHCESRWKNRNGTASAKAVLGCHADHDAWHLGAAHNRGDDGTWQFIVRKTHLAHTAAIVHHQRRNRSRLSAEDVLILTLSEFPARTKVHLGGVVMARSVKYLGRIASIKDQETRDSWWTELREEVSSTTL